MPALSWTGSVSGSTSRRCSTSSPPNWSRSRRRRPTRNFCACTASTPKNPRCSKTSRATSWCRIELGMTTVLVVPDGAKEVVREDWELEGRDAAYVDHVTDDLTGFLQGLAR